MDGDNEAAAAQQPLRGRRIKKKALKNKALAVSFNEKDLKDYVTGFHKRKKKRRKEAQKQVEEAQRRKRIELRKKRKLEREFGYGTASLEDDGSARDECDEHVEDDENEPVAPISGKTTYDNDNMKVTVITSEISREESYPTEKAHAVIARPSGSEKKHKVPVSTKKVFKKAAKKRQPQSKRDGKKGKKEKSKRRT